MIRLTIPYLFVIGLAACGPNTKPEPLAPQTDFCVWYKSYRYSPAAAAVEAPAALDAHNTNEMTNHLRCLLDPNRAAGPR